MRIFSTFTGIGGFELGIQKALDSFTMVGYSEIDKYAQSVFEYHFKGVKNYGDITKIKANELPDFDCLVGGFPCQAFSIAGKRAGFADTRGTLFFDLARILQAKQPRLFVFENVKGLLGHDNGNTFKTIIATITELGYDCQWQVLNSKDFGVPQNRERVYIVGHLRGSGRPKVFPIGKNDQLHNAPSSSDRSRPQAQLSTTIRVGTATKADSTFVVTPGTLRTHKDGNGFREVKSGIAPTIPARARQDGSGQGVIRYEHDASIRRLTPVECERLQGFPDNWTLIGKTHIDGAEGINTTALISDTQRYKMCGNAVTTNVISAVFERLIV